MGFLHSMTASLEGIEQTAPVQWRSFDGLVAIYWRARGRSGARGYYLSGDPRLTIFFDDVSPHIVVGDTPEMNKATQRPLLRAVYVPAGMPIWTKFISDHRFSHLDLHFREDWMLNELSPSLGDSMAREVIRQPVEIASNDTLDKLAQLLIAEICDSSRQPAFTEKIASAMLTGILNMNQNDSDSVQGGLTTANLRKLAARLDASPNYRMNLAEMAQVVGLSESWFFHAFKVTVGLTPHQWQQRKRVQEASRRLLDRKQSILDIAAQLGFSDQAHMTRVFSKISGETPAAWRRRHLAG